MTYQTLIQDIQSYLERGTEEDTIVFNQIPRLINMAERRLGRELKILGAQMSVTAVMTPGVPIIQKPTGWREDISIFIGTTAVKDDNTGVISYTAGTSRMPIFPRVYEYLRSFWPNEASRDTPKFYANMGMKHWIFAPTPDDAYPLEITYFATPEFLGEDNQTNWITDNYPQLLLYGTLMEASPFLKDDSRVQVWQTMYSQAMQDIITDNKSNIKDRSIERDTP